MTEDLANNEARHAHRELVEKLEAENAKLREALKDIALPVAFHVVKDGVTISTEEALSDAMKEISKCRQMASAALDNYGKIHVGMTFYATYKGKRYRFQAAEHFNIGRGWMLLELDGNIQGIVRDDEIQDIEEMDG